MLGAEAWPSLPEADKERVLAEIGETIAQVQRVPAGPLAWIEPGWDVFMRGRSRDAAHGTSVSDCRRNFWMGWMNCCAMPLT